MAHLSRSFAFDISIAFRRHFARRESIGVLHFHRSLGISRKVTEPPHRSSIQQRLAQLDEYVAQNPGKPVSAHLLELMPEVKDLADFGIAIAEKDRNIPAQAPELWKKGRLPREKPPAFVKRVYGPWLEELCLADIGRLDPPLYIAIENYKAYHYGLPSDLQLPTSPERNAKWVDAFRKSEGSDAKLSAMQRILTLAERRKKHDQVR